MLTAIVTLMGTTILAVVGWAVNTNSRVSVLEAQREDLKEFITAQFIDVKDRLARIERNQNGKHE